MREDFEKWYVETYMAMMVGGEAAIAEHRNDDGYGNDHIDGAWQAYKFRREWADHTIDFRLSVNKSVIVAVIIMIVIAGFSGLLYWASFSGNFYDFVMSFCEVCNGK